MSDARLSREELSDLFERCGSPGTHWSEPAKRAIIAHDHAQRELIAELKADAVALSTVIFLDGLKPEDFAKFHAAKITYTGADEHHIATYLCNLPRAAEALGWQHASAEFKGGHWRFQGREIGYEVLRQQLAAALRERNEARDKYSDLAEVVWQQVMSTAGAEMITGTPAERLVGLVEFLESEPLELSTKIVEQMTELATLRARLDAAEKELAEVRRGYADSIEARKR